MNFGITPALERAESGFFLTTKTPKLLSVLIIPMFLVFLAASLFSEAFEWWLVVLSFIGLIAAIHLTIWLEHTIHLWRIHGVIEE